MSIPSSFLSVENRKNKCLLCYHELLKGEKCQNLSEKGWKNFKEIANTWSDINIPLNDQIQNFTFVYDQVKNVDEPFGKVHTKCRTIFSTKRDIFANRYVFVVFIIFMLLFLLLYLGFCVTFRGTQLGDQKCYVGQVLSFLSFRVTFYWIL